MGKFRTTAIVMATFVTAGCSTLGNLASDFTDFSNPVASLSIRPESLSEPITYQPGHSCNYSIKIRRNGELTPLADLQITTKKSRDRILITHFKEGNVSTILLTPSGKVTNFNVPNKVGKRLGPDSANNNDFFHDLPTAFHPHFPGSSAAAESFYGQINGPKGETFAKLLYRGKTSFSGKEGITTGLVFDIMSTDTTTMTPNGSPIGRLVLSEWDKLPLALVFGASDRIQYERVSCTKS